MSVSPCFALVLITFAVTTRSAVEDDHEPCVPTAYIIGGCHKCICNVDGIWICYSSNSWCDLIRRKPIANECGEGNTYKVYNMVCECSKFGQWENRYCRNILGILLFKPTKRQLRPKGASCIPTKLYLVTCNICLCPAHGILEPSLCTARRCKAVHKSSRCNIGDALRTGNELCICSDVNYYIDRQCVTVARRSLQIIDRAALGLITALGKEPLIDLQFNNPHILRNSTFHSSEVTQRMDDGQLLGKNWPQEKSKQSNYDQLPALRSGQICTPGKTYKVDCNTCRCGTNNILLCTKMACLDRGALAALMQKRLLGQLKNSKKYQGGIVKHNIKKLQLDEERRHVGREGRPQNTSVKTLLYPDLPVGDCKPGKIYQVGCNRCFCELGSKLVCVEAECDDEVNSRLARTPRDVRPPFTKENIESLPALSHSSAKCTPGRSYRVDCNGCLCLADGNTLCGDLLCVSHEDMNSIAARQRSGAYCDTKSPLEQTGCVSCSCQDGVLSCKAVEECAAEVLRSLHKDVPESLDPTATTCVPGSVYKEDCNRCYCQPDKSMRCTRKKCLNYVQVKKLKKLRLELEKNGP